MFDNYHQSESVEKVSTGEYVKEQNSCPLLPLLKIYQNLKSALTVVFLAILLPRTYLTNIQRNMHVKHINVLKTSIRMFYGVKFVRAKNNPSVHQKVK